MPESRQVHPCEEASALTAAVCARARQVTLFSLLNGDSMLDVYTDIHRPGFGGLVADVSQR